MEDKSRPKPPIESLLTVKEVASIMGIAEKTLRNKLARRNGSAPVPVKSANGYNIMFDADDVRAWIIAHKEKYTTTNGGK